MQPSRLNQTQAENELFACASTPSARPHPFPRWGSVWLALLLALVIASASQVPLAQAAPAADAPRWYMDVANPKTKLCVGETAKYLVKAYLAWSVEPGTELPLSGVKIEATSSDKSVGTFKKNSAISGFDNEDLVTAVFSFTAKKPGKTNLFFEGLVDKKVASTYVSFTVPVTVIPCKFKVVTTSKMTASYPGGSIKFLGVIVGGKVTADENGYFTGTAPVVWISTSVVPGCGAVNSLGISNVKMRGNLNDSETLTLDLNYDPVSFKDVVKCRFGSGASSTSIQASPLNVDVPSANGGVVNRKQQLSGGPGGANGSALVYVIPVDGAK